MSQAVGGAKNVLTSTINPVNPLLAQGNSATNTVSNLLTPKIGAPGGTPVEAPVLAAPIVVPGTDDAAVQAARRRSIAQQLATRGRASTILTQAGSPSGEKLGV